MFSEEVLIDILGLQETSGSIFERRRQASASDSLGEEEKEPRNKKGNQRSHDQKMENKGKDKKKDRKHYHRRSSKCRLV
jgi:hypothetical protein